MRIFERVDFFARECGLVCNFFDSPQLDSKDGQFQVSGKVGLKTAVSQNGGQLDWSAHRARDIYKMWVDTAKN